MTVAEAVVERLTTDGIDTVFGIPGKQTLPLNRAMAAHGIRYVTARHETAVSHQAWGYAETSGNPAATVVVPGPGDMNAMNGLKNAYNDCTPLVHIAVETDPEIRGGDGIHETPPDTYDNVVKENYLVETPQSAAATVAEAVVTAQTHPKGPVRVGIPKNFLSQEVPQASPPALAPPTPPAPSADGIDEAVARLNDAQAPVLIAGGGVRSADAAADLCRFAEKLDAPVVTTYKGKGTMSENHPLSAGVFCGGTSPEVAAVVSEADIAVAIGTDFDAVATAAWSRDLPAELVHVTLNASDIGTGYEPTVALVADAKLTLQQLLERIPETTDVEADTPQTSDEGADTPETNDSDADTPGAMRAQTARNADSSRLSQLREGDTPPIKSPTALAAIRKALSRETVVAADAGGFRIWTLVSFPVFDSRSYVNPGSWATMGTALPSAIGAKVASPERDVVALTGDGGLMMCLHELHTLAAEDIDVTVVVFTNHDYAIISEEAERNYGFETAAYGWSDAPISFTAVAEGMCLDAVEAETPKQIGTAVAEAVESDGPTLVSVPTDPTEPQASEWMSRPR